MTTSKDTESLSLKWGTLKAWKFKSEKAMGLLKEYIAIGASDSAMMQDDTPRQKEIICELIDIGDFETVFMDWDGEDVSKEAAKKYVMEYGAKKSAASDAAAQPVR